jgi:hypothetical protein
MPAKAANDGRIEVLRQVLAKSAEQDALKRARVEAVDMWAKSGRIWTSRAGAGVVEALAERIEVGPAERGGTSTG